MIIKMIIKTNNNTIFKRLCTWFAIYSIYAHFASWEWRNQSRLTKIAEFMIGLSFPVTLFRWAMLNSHLNATRHHFILVIYQTRIIWHFWEPSGNLTRACMGLHPEYYISSKLGSFGAIPNNSRETKRSIIHLIIRSLCTRWKGADSPRGYFSRWIDYEN